MKNDNTGKRALKLLPPGKRRPERLKGTGRRSIETKLKKTIYKGNTIGGTVNVHLLSRNISKSKIERLSSHSSNT